MRTADGVPIAHGLRVWVTLDEPGTVSLARRKAGASSSGPIVYLDGGRVVFADLETVSALHPQTGREPPPLGGCKWVLKCGRHAVRMHPHRLMSPVPVCGGCVEAFGLQ